MNMKSFVRASLAMVMLCTGLFAQSKSEIVVAHMSQYKIVAQNGKESRVSLDNAQVKPGEVIEYVADYRNTDTRPVSNVMGRLPIPVYTTFVAESVTPKTFEVSTDGTKFGAYPLKRKQKNAAGAEVEVTVPDSEIRFVRWPLGQIAPGASKQVSARVRVSPMPAQQPARK